MNAARGATMTAFLLGGILGAAAGSWGQRAAMRHFLNKGRDPGHMMRRLDRELKLDDAQKGAIEAVLSKRRTDLDALKKGAQAKLEEIRTATDADIRESLRPDQREKFDALTARWKARMKERAESGFPPPPVP